ncbi:TPA: hypothetical protein ACR3Z0_006154 [Bacillus thuringiensis]|uniref:Uncharacterized protein n=1 Tax=Bacillus thuringiensis TaxID=1428 RepID=A0A9X6KPN1_BACTU|nr:MULTISPECIES: hypothetical protein [Bacillus cereus group]AJA23547.1 hypothetical protein BT4G5_32640 [Bacillus thuringiensis serovar galleriae]EJQ96327.1 hypothetical protein II5_06107 [Bacillus cereus MSX-A1]ETE93778.1 hypothetical protein C623_0224890 [Bacillus thuringiensis serovar aizawai str. Hu4-2]KAB1371504.1 hypothetical protein FPG93_30770 [Bacillus thuringiensis]KXI94607.1 hypothetical protein ACS47_00915 [Bacillus cereus]
MEKRELTILKIQLDETFKSIMISTLACLLTMMLSNYLHNTVKIPEWSTILIDQVIPWIYALTNIILLIKAIKIKRNMDSLT